MPEIESELFEAVLAGPLQILPAPTCPILWSDMTYAAQLDIAQIICQTSLLVEHAFVLEFKCFRKMEAFPSHAKVPVWKSINERSICYTPPPLPYTITSHSPTTSHPMLPQSAYPPPLDG
jgi:hypothetical protein